MHCRINWTEPWTPSVHPQKASLGGTGAGTGEEEEEGELGEGNSAFYGGEGADEGEGGGSDNSDSDSDGEADPDAEAEGGKGSAGGQQQHQAGAGAATMEAQTVNMEGNRCDLLWQGTLPKRSFTGFKFQQSQSEAAARKLMKSKGVGHYWDMVESADSILASSAAPSLF